MENSNIVLRLILVILSIQFGIVLNAQNIYTIVGDGNGGYNGDGIKADSAQIWGVTSMCFDRFGNLFLADSYNYRIRKVDTNGYIKTIAGKGTFGYSGDDDLAINAEINPISLVVDSAGNIYFTDNINSVIRKINTNGIISTIAGNGSSGYSGDRGYAINAKLNSPQGIAIDKKGNLFISDTKNNCVRKIDLKGFIYTIIGNGNGGFSGDGGQAINAKLLNPNGLTFDDKNNLYIADAGNNVIRKMNNYGMITTVAGSGKLNSFGLSDYIGDGGQAIWSELWSPTSVAVAKNGDIYISDYFNNRVRKVNNSTGVINNFAGAYGQGYNGDNQLPLKAQLEGPICVILDSQSNVYISDFGNNRIRKVNTAFPTPLKTNNLTGTIINDKVILKWDTVNEINTTTFIIEKSIDGDTFDSIASKEANTNYGNYNFYDNSPLNNIIYYRLKIIDQDGKYTYSNVLVLKPSTNQFFLNLYPNPVSNISTLSFNKNINLVQINVFDSNGKFVISKRFYDLYCSEYSLSVASLTNGFYTVKVLTKQGVFTKNILVCNYKY